jgi:hypothetical protein
MCQTVCGNHELVSVIIDQNFNLSKLIELVAQAEKHDTGKTMLRKLNSLWNSNAQIVTVPLTERDLRLIKVLRPAIPVSNFQLNKLACIAYLAQRQMSTV